MSLHFQRHITNSKLSLKSCPKQATLKSEVIPHIKIHKIIKIFLIKLRLTKISKDSKITITI